MIQFVSDLRQVVFVSSSSTLVFPLKEDADLTKIEIVNNDGTLCTPVSRKLLTDNCTLGVSYIAKTLLKITYR
jgi:DNA-directed RNA polymerase subunit L